MDSLVYVDAGLCDNLGHHANSCRHIVGVARSRNIPSAVLAFSGIAQSLQDELLAVPWFRCRPYATYHDDPICGWWRDFEFVAQTTCDDLRRLIDAGPNVVVYANSVQPPQFMGLVRWAKEMPLGRRPMVTMEFGTDPGVLANRTDQGFQYTPYPGDYRATMLRYTAGFLDETDHRWLRLATFDAQSSQAFRWVLGYPVDTLPLPQAATTSCRDRTGTRPITVAVLGHQRPDKGYAMVPELVLRLLAARDDIRVLVHNSSPAEWEQHQRFLHNVAAIDGRVILNEDVADLVLWSRLLESSDLIVCPYNRLRFMCSYSAVACEAIANAIPLVAPEGTTLHGILSEFGHPGTVFSEETLDSVFAAVIAALEDYDRLASTAKLASTRWTQTRGAKQLVDDLISWPR